MSISDEHFTTIKRTVLWLTIFAIAMAFLEAIVVVYLRQIFYPQGFSFPLNPLTPRIISIEWLREIATIVMLVSVGIIAGKNNLQKFAWFLFSFGVWDIFYYVGLKLLLDWPSSFFTWDILFLIPVVWVGPVLAPVINSLTMMLLAGVIVYLQWREHDFRINFTEWVLMISGAIAIFITFIWDYSRIIISNGFISDFWRLAENEHLQKIISEYQPDYYNWYLFAFGEMLVILAIGLILKRVKKKLVL